MLLGIRSYYHLSVYKTYKAYKAYKTYRAGSGILLMSKPTIAKFAFGLVLLAAIVFAFAVQQYKRSANAIDLDRPISLTAGGVDLDVTINSNWKTIDRSRLPAHVAAAWIDETTRPGKKIEIFLGGEANRYRLSTAALVASLSAYVPNWPAYGMKVISDGLDPLGGFTRVGAQVRFPRRGEARVMVVQVLQLPNGSVVDVAVAGPDELAGLVARWADQIMSELRVNLPYSVARADADEKIDLADWQITTGQTMWVARDQSNNLITLDPSGSDGNRPWIARIKQLTLPQYRSPESLINDNLSSLVTLDEPMRIFDSVQSGEYTICKGRRGQLAKLLSPLDEVELAYLVLAADRSALLLTITTESKFAAKTERLFDQVTKQIRQSGSATNLKPIVIGEFLSKVDLSQFIPRLSGWYEIVFDGRLAGFEMQYFIYDPNDATVSGVNFYYLKVGTRAYRSRSVLEFSEDMKYGQADSQLYWAPGRGSGKPDHRIANHVEFTGQKITHTVQIDRRRIGPTSITQPAEFAGDGAEQFLLAILAGSADVRADLQNGVVIAQQAIFSPGLRNIQLKPLTEQDGFVRIAVLSDSSLDPVVYLFAQDGMLVGYDTGWGTKVRRSTSEKIERRFPTQFGQAVRLLRQLVGE